MVLYRRFVDRHNEIVYLVHVLFVDILLPQILVDGLIDICFETGHISICFWALGAKISDSRHLWVGEGGHSFSHDGWMVAGTVCCSKVSFQFLHCSGKFFGCSWFKVKITAFQVSAPALEVSFSFGIRAWFISRFIAAILLGLGGLPLFYVIQELRFITLRWTGWF